MKTNELMIGDWVQVPSELNRKKQIKSTFDLDSAVLYQPIPLTPEILEKNFESESNIFGLQTYKLNENFNLENRGDRFCLVRKCRDYYSSTFWICDFTYLHELQHALRLCEIDKEIEL